MALKSYEFHHHFPRIAEESGFAFNVHRPRAHVDWSKIRLIDVDGLIKERKFGLIEHHLNDILHCVLESEFDVRILDEGVLKMFRLAQLAVEYQQFCRHYLDRSVCLLREEITELAQELDTTKKSLREKEEELKKLKRKTKHPYRAPLAYGNENIATMILKTLTNKNEMFPTTSNTDPLQYNKCSYCDKVFLNQLYLKSHLSRRHTDMSEIPQKDVADNYQNISSEKENCKLNEEIMELKTKLKEMESLMIKFNEQPSVSVVPIEKPEAVNNEQSEVAKKQTKDAEVSTNNEILLLDKIEEWKKEEHEKYNKEINLLRAQIVEIVNSFKPKEEKKPDVDNNHNLIEQLHTTIKQQGAEIHNLKQELYSAKLRTENEELGRKQELDSQMALWAKRADAQTKQYEVLLQKLNDVAQEAHEARTQAEAERSRAAQLQQMLQETLMNNKLTETENKSNGQNLIPHKKQNGDIRKRVVKRKLNKANPVADSKTLESLHRKAQELLNMASSSSSETSSASFENERLVKTTSKNGPNINLETSHKNNVDTSSISNRNKVSKSSEKINNVKEPSQEVLTTNSTVIKEAKIKKEKSKSSSNIAGKMGNGTIIAPGSPVKLVRYKISEEVNNRLVSIGVDPLKNKLPKGHFQKQRIQLQQDYEHKSKKNPDYQKVKHSILAFLDSNVSEKKREISHIEDYVSPNRSTKTFSLASVISNVKSKALSLVKPKDNNVKFKRKEINAEVAKKALMLLKTPPDSAPNSPAIQSKVVDSKQSSDDKKPPLPKKKKHELITVGGERHLRPKKQIKPKIEDSSESDHRYYNPTAVQQPPKSIENLIKSPARRPASATADYSGAITKLSRDNTDLLRSQSEVNIAEFKVNKNVNLDLNDLSHPDDTSDEISAAETSVKKKESERNIPKQTKGVLKNASSTSSLNKKKVLFDMDAIQMKSVSASPAQSITEKSDNEKFELGLVNFDGEEWDISSIENEPIKNEIKVMVNSRASPKIAELKQIIESQLARRTETPSTALVGGVNLMPTPMTRTSSIAGSNTSLGSSILDESDGIPTGNHKAFIKPKKIAENEESEVDISEYSFDGVVNTKKDDSF